jgi:hypothetical protein
MTRLQELEREVAGQRARAAASAPKPPPPTPPRGLDPSESAILQRVHRALAVTGRVVIWRNNSGALPAIGRGGRSYPLRYGLGVGGADLVGLLKPSGRFFAIEVKTAIGKQSDHQKAWERAVVEAGGFYRIVRSAEEALEALDAASAAVGAVEP